MSAKDVRTRAIQQRCPNCPPKGHRCYPCIKERQKELWTARMADPATAAAEAARRKEEYQRRKATPGWHEARQERQRKSREARRLGLGLPAQGSGGRRRTLARCEACPATGRPCRDCYNLHRRLTRATQAKAPTAGKPIARRVVLTPEQREERSRLAAEKKAARAAAARELAAARKARAKAEREPVNLAAEVAREVSRPQPCLGCLTRGHHANGYCRRCQVYASAPPAPRIAYSSYTSDRERIER